MNIQKFDNSLLKINENGHVLDFNKIMGNLNN